MLRGFAKVTCYHSFLFLLILFKNKDPVLKYFLSFHDRIMHFSFNLLMWLEPFPGVEFLAQWFTHKTLWIGSRESNMPGHNAIRAWLTHKKALRKDRWWDIMDLTTSGSGAYLNYSTNLTELQVLSGEGFSYAPRFLLCLTHGHSELFLFPLHILYLHVSWLLIIKVRFKEEHRDHEKGKGNMSWKVKSHHPFTSGW